MGLKVVSNANIDSMYIYHNDNQIGLLPTVTTLSNPLTYLAGVNPTDGNQLLSKDQVKLATDTNLASDVTTLDIQLTNTRDAITTDTAIIDQIKTYAGNVITAQSLDNNSTLVQSIISLISSRAVTVLNMTLTSFDLDSNKSTSPVVWGTGSSDIAAGVYQIEFSIVSYTYSGSTKNMPIPPTLTAVITNIATSVTKTIQLNGVSNYYSAIVRITAPSTLYLVASKSITAIDANLELLKLA